MHRSDHFRANMGRLEAAVAFTQTYSTATTTVPAVTAGAGTGADGTTPSGAEYALTNADVLVNRKLINGLIDALQAAGIGS